MESTFQPKTNVQPIITQAPRIVRARRCVSFDRAPKRANRPQKRKNRPRRLQGSAPRTTRPPQGGCRGATPHKQQRRPKAAAGPCPEDNDAAPRAAPAGPCRRAKAREPPVGSAASYPPEGFPLSTFGDGGLNCRVRDGTGCAPSSMAADPTGGSCESSLAGGHPGGQHSAQDFCRSLRRQHGGRV